VAVALTQLFLDVVLVDADLRRPTLTNLFDLVDVPGLGDFLAGTATLDQVLSPTSVERLRMVPAGVVVENPGNLLGRPALATFCRSIAEKADVVIIDTSPIAACNDALSIGQHIDTTVMVISPRRWDGDVEVRIRQTLEQHKVPLMGVVLNGSVPGEGYGGPYGYGSKNQSEYTYGYYGYDYPKSPREGKRQRSFWSRLKGLFGPEP
jgi:capsular exopolysaccharide synthesis family protein